jgi:AcrR family transcriptional regulator
MHTAPYFSHTAAYDEAHKCRATKKRVKARLGREDWIRAALDAIAAGGLAAVAVEPLARRLGVTKGSFYAHFSSRDELIEAALESWERSHAQDQLEQCKAIDDPAERVATVLRVATEFSQSGAPSVHARLMGELDDDRVRAAVARVTSARLERLASSYRELGLSDSLAADRARLAYATYIGLLQMAREAPESRMDEKELERFLAELRRALIESGQA